MRLEKQREAYASENTFQLMTTSVCMLLISILEVFAPMQLRADEPISDSELTFLAIELLDDQNRPLPNYSGEQAGRVSSDGVQQEIIWPASSSLHIDLKQPFSIRVSLPANDRVRVYAIYINE